MKNCPNCSAPCGDNDRFCSNCGSPLPLGPTAPKNDSAADFFGHPQQTTPPAGNDADAPLPTGQDPQSGFGNGSGTGYSAPENGSGMNAGNPQNGNAAQGNPGANGYTGFGYGTQQGYDPYRGQQSGYGRYGNPYYPPQPQAPVQNEGSGFGYGCLGFFFPLVGLILFLVWRNEHPRRAKSAGIGALISVILTFAIPFLVFFFAMFVSIASCGEAYEDPYYYEAVTSLCRLLLGR